MIDQIKCPQCGKNCEPVLDNVDWCEDCVTKEEQRFRSKQEVPNADLTNHGA